MTPWAETMNARQAAGLCRLCGEPQAPGVALCELHRVALCERMRNKRKARTAAGLCVLPKCTRAPLPGGIRCEPCRAKFQKYNTAWQRRNRAQRANENESN